MISTIYRGNIESVEHEWVKYESIDFFGDISMIFSQTVDCLTYESND